QRPMILPLVDGEPTPPAEIARLQAAGAIAADDVARMRERAAHYQRALETVNLKTQDVHTRHREAVRALFQDEVEATLDRECDRVRREFDGADVARFLADLVADVRQHHAAIAAEPALARRYRVNLLSAHREDEPCPVVVENAPSARNLLGGIDRPLAPGDPPLADHLMIHAGALLRADGGFLLLDAREVLAEPGAWRALMRTLRNGQLEITPPQQGPNGGAVLTPEPIPVRVKVVLIGEPDVHAALDSADPDFPQLFKVLADFDSTMPSDTQGVTMYASVLARLADAEGLSHFDATAVAAIAEHGARIASRQDRLTTRFGRLADIAREAAFVAGKAGAELVGAEHVREAVRRTRRRTDLPARRFSERIAEGVIRIQTRGSTVGQINGLAVTHAGPLTYGFPARITATIGPGTAGTINIEREANLSGAIHTKGFYILGGLLRHLLRTDHPLAFSASIAFEQSYGGIDGDSASGAEACCLLSALTGVAIRQDRAMTGAIDQHGHIQPVGAVTEKVEGFFDVCRDAGLTGTQGVLLPRANVRDLMLRPDVVEACAAGRFHVWAVETVHEALAVLTGCPAGERGADGAYPTGTLLALAEARAGAYWEQATAGLRLAGLDVSP
ncbi:MAG: AAA family ATPase, partial [Myxococcales bacterium]|nr:AAA family ATPase [Myxococcales bacterium]